MCRSGTAAFRKYIAGLLLATTAGWSGDAFGDTLIVPSVTMSERYDSNVFLIPPIMGFKREDYVSSLSPQLNIIDRGEQIQTNFQVAGIGEKYINNPQLDYVGGSANLALNLNRLVQRYIPNLTLTISDGVFYSPQAPAFSTPTFGEDPSALGRGIQVVRVNTFANSSNINGTYRITPATTLRVGYSNQIIRFGRSFVNVGNTGLIDTDAHTLTAGPFIQMNVRDTLGVNYFWQRIDFRGGQIAGLQDGYEAHGANLAWQRVWVPELRTNAFAGASVITAGSGVLGGGSGAASQVPENLVVWNGGFSAFWTDLIPGAGQNQLTGLAGFGGSGGFGGAGGLGGGSGGAGSMMGGGAAFGTGARTTAIFSYSAGVYPSYFAAGVPLISHVVTATGSRRLGSSWAIAGSADYARNDSLASGSGVGSDVSYRAYGGNLSLTYLITTGMFVSLTGDYHRFDGEGLSLGGALSGAELTVDRYFGMISLTKVWLP